MAKRVILNAMIEPFPAKMLRPDDEVWVVSGAFRHQRGVTRVFCMDELHYFPEGFDSELNLLPPDVRVITTRHIESVPRSEPYPIHDVINYFHGQRYFSSTAAYMMALAIKEGFEEIVISGMYYQADSNEYQDAIPCMNFWFGIALGKGCRLGVHGPCSIAMPHPWSTGLYGYETITTRKVITDGLAATYLWAANFPKGIDRHVDIDAPDFEQVARGEVTHAIA